MPGRGSRSIKPDPNQPSLKSLTGKPIRLSSEHLNYKGTKTPTESKRKRRSTGDKRAAKRSKELELKKTSMTPTAEKNQDQHQDPTDKMANPNPAIAEDIANRPNTDMVQEMRNMEARLKGSRKTELDELEVKLTNSMKTLLDKSVEDALKKLHVNISQEITKHPTIQQHSSELVQLRAENQKLNQQVKRLDSEFSKLQSKISDMEQ